VARVARDLVVAQFDRCGAAWINDALTHINGEYR
jgi:hypothetical protein